MSAVNLMSITTGKLKDFVRDSDEAPLQFHVDIPAELPPIRGNANAIEGAIINLLLNAADTVREKGRGRITLKAEEAVKDWVMITVEDTGTGIAPDILKRVYEPYFTTKSQGGTGLGLSIVRNTIEVHGGRIEMDSQLAVGTCIRLVFPVSISSRQ
jgi:signal transduction histidine kinase